MARDLTDGVYASIVESLDAGNYLETAAAVAGVPIKRVRTWLALGEDPASEYAGFRADVLQAMARSESKLVEILNTAASAGEFKAAQWLLERRYPRWALKVRQAVEREQEHAVERVLALESQLGREAIDAVLAALAGEDSEAAPLGAEGDELH